MPPKKLSERSRTLAMLEQAMQRKQARLVRYGSQGAASDVRRINPKTGRMIEILPRTR
jgi:hypothetical protein